MKPDRIIITILPESETRLHVDRVMAIGRVELVERKRIREEDYKTVFGKMFRFSDDSYVATDVTKTGTKYTVWKNKPGITNVGDLGFETAT